MKKSILTSLLISTVILSGCSTTRSLTRHADGSKTIVETSTFDNEGAGGFFGSILSSWTKATLSQQSTQGLKK